MPVLKVPSLLLTLVHWRFCTPCGERPFLQVVDDVSRTQPLHAYTHIHTPVALSLADTGAIFVRTLVGVVVHTSLPCTARSVALRIVWDALFGVVFFFPLSCLAGRRCLCLQFILSRLLKQSSLFLPLRANLTNSPSSLCVTTHTHAQNTSL